jgi:hypothetical protein
MKVTTIKLSDIAKHPTKRMDAAYWLKEAEKKKNKKNKKS